MILSGVNSPLKTFFSGIAGSSNFPTCLLYEVDGGGWLDPEAIWGPLYNCLLWGTTGQLGFHAGKDETKA